MQLFQERQHDFFIEGPEGRIEAVIDGCPKGCSGVAIVCHPHPLYAGTMHNKVAHTLARAYRDSGIAAIRFNFRGVGQSDGHYGEGDGEVEDLRAVYDWLMAQGINIPVYLAGFSFGSMVAARGCEFVQPVHLTIVAPPAGKYDYPDSFLCPALLMQGTEDEVCDAQDAFVWAEKLQSPIEVEVFDGGSHFFHGALTDLKRRLMTHLAEV
jgi:alpha/beta superfamily hydrolase